MKVIAGNKDVIELLLQSLEAARKGELVGIVICGITEMNENDVSFLTWEARVREGTPYANTRLIAAVDVAHQALMARNLFPDG